MSDETLSSRHTRMVAVFGFVAIAMFAFGFILAPFYSLLCEWTGIGGQAQTAAKQQAAAYVPDLNRKIGMEFVTMVNEMMPLKFWVEKPKLPIHPGESYTMNFYATNLSAKKLVGRAVPSVAPAWVTQYLEKSECFCFSEQSFEPGQTRQLTVRFVIAPGIPADINDLTLSYTFFDITEKASAEN